MIFHQISHDGDVIVQREFIQIRILPEHKSDWTINSYSDKLHLYQGGASATTEEQKQAPTPSANESSPSYMAVLVK